MPTATLTPLMFLLEQPELSAVVNDMMMMLLRIHLELHLYGNCVPTFYIQHCAPRKQN